MDSSVLQEMRTVDNAIPSSICNFTFMNREPVSGKGEWEAEASDGSSFDICPRCFVFDRTRG